MHRTRAVPPHLTAPFPIPAPCPGSVPATFGQELIRGLLNADPTLAVPSAAVAAHLLRGNPAAKAHALTLPVEGAPGSGEGTRYVLPTLAATVTGYYGCQGAHTGGKGAVDHRTQPTC